MTAYENRTSVIGQDGESSESGPHYCAVFEGQELRKHWLTGAESGSRIVQIEWHLHDSQILLQTFLIFNHSKLHSTHA